MIKLNLISPNYKKIIRTKHLLFGVRNLFLYITLFTTISAIILLIARKALEDNFIKSLGQTAIISKSPAESEKNAKINEKIKLTQTIQSDYIPWSRLIIKFSELIPDNIKIDSLNITPDKEGGIGKMNISGFAVKRDDFLILKENLLQADELFDNVDIPITNLFQKEDINFNINLPLKKETLTSLSL